MNSSCVQSQRQATRGKHMFFYWDKELNNIKQPSQVNWSKLTLICYTWEVQELFQEQFHVLKRLRTQNYCLVLLECSHKCSESSLRDSIPGPCGNTPELCTICLLLWMCACLGVSMCMWVQMPFEDRNIRSSWSWIWRLLWISRCWVREPNVSPLQ